VTRELLSFVAFRISTKLFIDKVNLELEKEGLNCCAGIKSMAFGLSLMWFCSQQLKGLYFMLMVGLKGIVLLQ